MILNILQKWAQNNGHDGTLVPSGRFIFGFNWRRLANFFASHCVSNS